MLTAVMADMSRHCQRAAKRLREENVPLTSYTRRCVTGWANWTFIVIDPSAASTSSTAE